MQINRRNFLGIAGASLSIPGLSIPSLPVLGLISSPAIAQGDDLGFEWQVHEEVPGGRFWQGTWRRRGGSNVFDARWRDSDSGGIVRDVIEVQSYNGSSITLFRHGNGGTYYGQVSGRSIRGSASWYPQGAFWRARIR